MEMRGAGPRAQGHYQMGEQQNFYWYSAQLLIQAQVRILDDRDQEVAENTPTY